MIFPDNFLHQSTKIHHEALHDPQPYFHCLVVPASSWCSSMEIHLSIPKHLHYQLREVRQNKTFDFKSPNFVTFPKNDAQNLQSTQRLLPHLHELTTVGYLKVRISK